MRSLWKTSNLCCLLTGGFPTERANIEECIFMSWRHQDNTKTYNQNQSKTVLILIRYTVSHMRFFKRVYRDFFVSIISLSILLLILFRVSLLAMDQSLDCSSSSGAILKDIGQRGRCTYRKVSNIRRTKFPNLNVSRFVLQLSLPNLMKPGVKSRMKM